MQTCHTATSVHQHHQILRRRCRFNEPTASPTIKLVYGLLVPYHGGKLSHKPRGTTEILPRQGRIRPIVVLEYTVQVFGPFDILYNFWGCEKIKQFIVKQVFFLLVIMDRVAIVTWKSFVSICICKCYIHLSNTLLGTCTALHSVLTGMLKKFGFSTRFKRVLLTFLAGCASC